MPEGRFEADFSSFVDETNKAVMSLDLFEHKSVNVGKNTTSAFDQMKGSAVSLAGALGLAFSVGGAVAFGKSILDGASALVDLSTKTGASVEQLQRWQFVGAQSSVTADQFAEASFKLGVNLAGGSGSVRDAVEKLGLSYAELKKQSPDQQFNATVRAIEAMENPQERNRLALELFGKTFAAIAPAVAKGYTDMAAQARVSSDAQVHALAEASNAWTRWRTGLMADATAGAGIAVIAGEQFLKLTAIQKLQVLTSGQMGDMFFKLYDAGLQATTQGAAHTAVVKAETNASLAYTQELVKTYGVLSRLSSTENAGIASALALGKAHEEIARDFAISDAALKIFIDRQGEAKKASTDLADAEKRGRLEVTKLWDEYNALRVSHGGSANEIAIAQINKWAADAEAAAIKAGTATTRFYEGLAAVSHEKIAAVGIDWNLFETKSKSAMAEAAANALATYNEMVKSGKFYRDELDAQLAKYHELDERARGYGDTAAAALTKAAALAKQCNADLDRMAAGVVTHFREMNEGVMGIALSFKGWNDEVMNVNRSLDGTILDTKELIAEQKRLRALGSSVQYDLSTPEGQAAFMAANPRATIGAGGEIVLDTRIQNRPPGMAEGGVVTVGERGPEVVRLPFGSQVFPHGSGGVTVNIQVSGVMDPRTIRELSKSVGTEVMRQAGIGRQFGSA